MKANKKLFMVMLGCRPKGRLTEQHDIFFGIGTSLSDLLPDMKTFWPEAKGKIHIDAWQEITQIDDYLIKVVSKNETLVSSEKLFFLNLGGYKENEFEEYHYKVLTVASSKSEAIKKSKQTTFYKHCGFKGAVSHIDDKYGVDVDDIYEISDILDEKYKTEFQLKISKTEHTFEDVKHIGYLPITKL